MAHVIQQAIKARRRAGGGLGWKGELALLIRSYVEHKVDGRALSSRTRAAHFEVLLRLFGELREAGFKARPGNLCAKHVHWLRDRYAARLREGSIEASTLQTYFSVLRRFADATGHAGLVKPMAELFPDDAVRRQLAAGCDKSWSGNGVELEAVLAAVWAQEPWVAMALVAQAAFGLRRREAACLRVAAGSDLVAIEQGAKGGRRRIVVLETEAQRAVRDAIAAWVAARDGVAGGSIGPVSGDGDDLRRNLVRYATVMRAVGITRNEAGVTGHGLRAEWAIDWLERRGHVPAVRVFSHAKTHGAAAESGDGAGRLPSADERVAMMADRAALAQAMGHGRVSVTSAYAGLARGARVSVEERRAAADAADRAARAIGAGLSRGELTGPSACRPAADDGSLFAGENAHGAHAPCAAAAGPERAAGRWHEPAGQPASPTARQAAGRGRAGDNAGRGVAPRALDCPPSGAARPRTKD